jgi:hypothetical protein
MNEEAERGSADCGNNGSITDADVQAYSEVPAARKWTRVRSTER